MEHLRKWASLVPNQSRFSALCWNIERLVGNQIFQRQCTVDLYHIEVFIVHVTNILIMLKWTEDGCSIHNLYIIILVSRDSLTLTLTASRNMGKHGGKSACCTVLCVCVYACISCDCCPESCLSVDIK